MTITLLFVIAFLAILLLAAVNELRIAKKNAAFINDQLVETTEESLATVKALRDRINTLEVALLEKNEPVMTASDIVEKVIPRRLRLRQSLSEQVAAEAAKHNTKNQKHIDIVKNMESLGVKDAAMRVAKEKK